MGKTYLIQGIYDTNCGWEDLEYATTKTDAIDTLQKYKKEDEGYQHRIIELQKNGTQILVEFGVVLKM